MQSLFILLLGPLITAPRFLLPCHLYMYKIFRISIILAVSSNTSIVIVFFRTYCRALLVELISGDKKSSTWSDDSGGWWSSFYLLVRRLNPTNRLLKSIISSFSTSPFFILTTGISIVFHGTSTDITTTTIGLVPSSTLRVKIYLACDLYLLKIARPEFVFQEKGLEGASNMNFWQQKVQTVCEVRKWNAPPIKNQFTRHTISYEY